MIYTRKEKIDKYKSSVKFVPSGNDDSGIYLLLIQGTAPIFSYGFNLVQCVDSCGRLKFECTAKFELIGEGRKPFTVNGSFTGKYCPTVIVSAANGDFSFPVREVSISMIS